MRRRGYRLGKRAESASATRQRIVEATLTLHDEQGITGTSVRDVAGRAGVAPATVLHHFPRMDDLIQACGELSDAMAPMPTEAIFAAEADRPSRVRVLTLELFGWWERLGPGWNHLQVDRTALRQVDAWLNEVRERHRRLVGIALGSAGAPHVEVVTAMTTQGAWSSMCAQSGIDTKEAATQVARLINRSLEAVH